MKQSKIEAILPLTPMQAGILFHALDRSLPGVYFEQVACQIRGDLDLDLFRDAWQQLVQRHAALRTFFTWERREQPLQIVYRDVELPWTVADWQDLEPEEQARNLQAFQVTDRATGFDLTRAPLVRLALIRLAPARYQLVWSFHHLISDGWSTALLLREVFGLYEALREGREPDLAPARPYRDYVTWLRQQELAPAEAYWRRLLAGFTVPTPLPAAGPAGAEMAYGEQSRDLAAATVATLESAGRSRRLTLSTLIQGAWAILLHRYGGDSDVVFGATVAGRPPGLSGVETMVGLFINTLPVRVTIAPEAILADWLQRLQTQLVASRQFEFSPLASIKSWSDVPGDQPLFESIVVFENYPMGDTRWPADLTITDLRYVEQSNYPLALLAVPQPGDGLRFHVVYDGHRYEGAMIELLLDHLVALLTGMARDLDQRLDQLPGLGERERRLLATWNETAVAYPRDRRIHDLIAARARQTPEAVAVIFEDQRLSYGELEHRAGRLAHRLRDQGIGPGDIVGLCAERSPIMIVGLLAILQAGAAYLPLDPAYPAERLAFYLADSQAAAVLTTADLEGALPATGIPTLCLDIGDGSAPAGQTPGAAADITLAPGAPTDPAYVIYTSGSTGRPKGVVVSHRNLVHSTTARDHVYPEKLASFLLLSSFAFDSSVVGLFWTLCQGGALVLPRQGDELDVGQLAQLIQAHQVSHLLALPTHYGQLLTYSDPVQLASLRVAIVAGEACPAALVQQHGNRLPRTALYNEYGPTEGTVWATVYRADAADSGPRVPIGRPIPNVRVYLLDARRRPVPLGAPGELCLGGEGIVAGYLNRPEQTAQAFIPDPLAAEPGNRLYCTGDLARFRPDGHLEFLGRVDQQVKIRGYRIELEEIEAVLSQHPALKEAVVLVNETGAPAENETGTAADETASAPEALVDILQSLPEAEADRLLAAVEASLTAVE